MEVPQLTRQTLDEVFQTFGLDAVMSAEEYEEGVGQLESELRRLGLDADAAQLQRLPFSRAVLDFDNYPFLARFHAYVDNVLNVELPPALIAWLCQVLTHRADMVVHMEAMSQGLVQMSAAARSPLQALAKFLLFELVRLELVLSAQRYPQEVFRLGLELDDLSNLAENCVDTWLREVPPEDVRSLPILVEAARRKFADLKRSAEMKKALVSIQEDLLREIRTKVEKELCMCEPKNSLLVRNEMPALFGTLPLSMEELRSRNRHILGNESLEALYKRSQRMKKRGHIPRRKGIALLDFMRMVDGEEAIR